MPRVKKHVKAARLIAQQSADATRISPQEREEREAEVNTALLQLRGADEDARKAAVLAQFRAWCLWPARGGLRMTQLRSALESRGLDSNGLRKDLIARMLQPEPAESAKRKASELALHEEEQQERGQAGAEGNANGDASAMRKRRAAATQPLRAYNGDDVSGEVCPSLLLLSRFSSYPLPPATIPPLAIPLLPPPGAVVRR